jgi:peptidoglycan/xylan/chitin deacetylase (PgdA/CDA1 family)
VARRGVIRRAALKAARHDLVLLYHRLGREREPELVPTIAPSRLQTHLEVLLASGPIVPLHELVAESQDPAPRFAVTFDDDYASHADSALPVLTRLGVPATFFLCGRSLHGLGVLWWERLEALIAAEGAEAAARLLGRPGTPPDELARALEHDPDGQRLVTEAQLEGTPPLKREDVRALVAAGMDIGYHTMHHPLLTSLDDAALDQALSLGRAALEDQVGRPLEQFAYPHGKADRRVATAARRAGYRAAWTGWPAPLRGSSDRFLLPRWEPGRLDEEAFAAAVVIRLHRAAPAHREALRG